jgi:two-component system, chemotaxis family, chemotaxis protein CheY
MPGTGLETLKALIVEDNQHMRMLLRSLLNAVGMHDVSEAADGRVAVRVLAEKKKCDLILCDFAMKPMDGLDFVREVRRSNTSANPFVPIIMISGYTEKHRVEAARDAGITEFLAKPITTQNLYARIAEIMERPRAFIRAPNYFGPDRRRKTSEAYHGPWRRHDDTPHLVHDLEVQ